MNAIGSGIIVLALWLTAVCVPAASVRAADDDLIAAASADHLWFIQPAEKDKPGFELCHHSAALHGPFYRVQAKLAQKPDAMAAAGNRVWLVFPPQDGAGTSGREVYTVEAQFNPAFGSFYVVPNDRLEPETPLPGAGRLASFVGTSDGPAALLWPSPRTPPTKQPPEPERPRIVQLVGTQWLEIQPPAEVDVNRPGLLAAAGTSGKGLVLLAPTSTGRQILRDDLLPSGEWTRAMIDLDLRRVKDLARHGNQLAAAIEDTQADIMMLAYLRAEAYLPVATVPRPAGPFRLVPLGSELGILQASGKRSFSLLPVYPATGTSGPTKQLVIQPMSATRAWQLGLVLAAIVLSILLLFVVKPLIAPDSPLPRGIVLLSPVRRVMALGVDLLPGAAASLVLLRCSPVDLLQAPVMTFDATALAPNITMMALTAVYTCACELLWATTLGKWIAGGRIETIAQERPSAARVLLRNAVKFFVLLVPPLGLVVLLNPHMQGLQDVAGRTLVVSSAREHDAGPGESEES